MHCRTIAIAFALLPSLALAQQQPPQAPEQQALGSMLLEAMQREASVRTQLVSLQAEVTALRKAAEDAKAPPKDKAP